jgi:hypothetical protein
VPFTPGGDGSYAFETDLPAATGAGWLALTEDVLLFATLGDPDAVEIGIAPRAWGPLTGDFSALSCAVGGTQSLNVRAGAVHGGSTYLVLGSLSGTYPGIPAGTTLIPLVFDGYTQFALASPNQPPLGQSFGLLDALGSATATFTLPPGATPSLAGQTVCHACVVLDLASTNPVALVLNPASTARSVASRSSAAVW